MRVLALSCLLSSLYSVVSSSSVGLLSTFTPPNVFQITNLLRTVDLTKPYIRETIAAVVENSSNEPQSEFYVPFPKEVIPKISYVNAKDKKGTKGEFATE